MHEQIRAREGKRLNVIVETPRGSRNKFTYEPGLGVFRLGKQLPAGAVFPFDFGFVPSTRAPDGDPLDALVLLDTPTFPGCLVRARVLGVIDGRQTGRSGRTVGNPRLVAVATKSNEYDGIRRLKDLPTALVDEIEHFFVSYNAACGKVFEPIGRHGRRRAKAMIRAAAVAGPRDRVPGRRRRHEARQRVPAGDPRVVRVA
jgi:inorganic pyrophosphatase